MYIVGMIGRQTYMFDVTSVWRHFKRFKVTNNIKDYHQKKKKEHEENFQSWSEFRARGFRKPEYMTSWIIEGYGPPDEVLKQETINLPEHKVETAVDARRSYLYQAVRQPNDVLIKVHAASLNPIDIRMCEGYGRNLFNLQRNALFHAWKVIPSSRPVTQDAEFPLVLGRDFSGTIVDVGTGVVDLQPGDDVYGAASLFKNGTLSEYVCVDLANVVQKPLTLSHIEAASIPFVGLTVVSALRRVVKTREKSARALVIGGSGGIGTFAIQYLRAHGFSVTTTCSTSGMKLCSSLGAECIDYKLHNVDSEVTQLEKFGVVFDAVGAVSSEWAERCLLRGGVYTTLKSPFVVNTDKYGAVFGVTASLLEFARQRFMHQKITTEWGFFKPDRHQLLEIARMIDGGIIKPAIDANNIFSFEDVPKAFKSLAAGHTKGKIVINVSNLPEAVRKPPVDKIIHL